MKIIPSDSILNKKGLEGLSIPQKSASQGKERKQISCRGCRGVKVLFGQGGVSSQAERSVFAEQLELQLLEGIHENCREAEI